LSAMPQDKPTLPESTRKARQEGREVQRKVLSEAKQDLSEMVTQLNQIEDDKHRAILEDLVWLTGEETAQMHGLCKSRITQIKQQYPGVMNVLITCRDRLLHHRAQKLEALGLSVGTDFMLNGRTTRKGGPKISSVQQLSFLMSSVTQAQKISLAHQPQEQDAIDPIEAVIADAQAALDPPSSVISEENADNEGTEGA